MELFLPLFVSLSLFCTASNCDKPRKSCFVCTTPKFTPAVRTLQVAFRNSTIAKDLKHNEETTRLQKNKQTNKQRGWQDCKEHETRKDREAEGKKKKTRVADNYRILENTTTTKKEKTGGVRSKPRCAFHQLAE
jgi:hypothetical protein